MPPSLTRRTVARCLLASAVAPAALPAWAGFNFFTSEYTISRTELQVQIGKRFPVTQRYAEIFSVSLSDPQLTLDARANRAAVTARLSIRNALFEPQSVGGVVSVSSALRYDTATRTLRLEQPLADRIELHGLAGRDAERLQQIGALVAQELLRGYPLRTFSADELTVGRKTYEIGSITVLDDGIKVELK